MKVDWVSWAWIAIAALGVGCAGVAFIYWAATPSPWTRPETPYTECLRIILQSKEGNLASAETMCAMLRGVRQ